MADAELVREVRSSMEIRSFISSNRRKFDDLSEPEILALAIACEEEDGHIYADLAEDLREAFPASAEIFAAMQREESDHRRRLLEDYQRRFGDHLPSMRREDVRGFAARRPVWRMRPLNLEDARRLAGVMERETRQFYEQAAARSTDPATRRLLGDLAEAEAAHVERAGQLEEEKLPPETRAAEDAHERRLFVLQIVQPGLAGLMDGSVSTLAPVFAAAFATKNSWDAFLVGMAASIGAGISMGFAEALSDDGALSGRGKPLLRGTVCGLMTTAGGIGHTLPYLIGDFRAATAVAIAVVAVELAAIAWIRHHYMDTPLLRAAFQVVVGGILVFLTGILIGSA